MSFLSEASRGLISNNQKIVPAQDFMQSAFLVTMRRCQALALESSRKPVPCPAAQLAWLKETTSSGKKHRNLAHS